MLSISMAVDMCVEILDREYPDWRTKVDINLLEMGDESTCILGQIYGDFYVGLDALGLKEEGSYLYGLNAYNTQTQEQVFRFEDLNKEWKQRLNNE